ncbi:MAG TPA: hypothetical protein VN253_23395 [Kofleriaceae bacterium]|nr:hypothetical protein [Kofleriaceae bacterium]
MIRIHRRAAVPTVLLTKGVARRQEHEAELDSDPTSFSIGSKKIEFDRSVYAHESVKEALLEMQHEKCAFCEGKPLPHGYGDVEHFRPKGEVRQDDDDDPKRPGYYWLAYDWSNLLFACQLCNQRHKKSLFPLADPAQRAQTHRDTVAHEAPLFIDPSTEDPRKHISYREHVPIAIGGNARGERTIGALGLRRAELNADREEHLAKMLLLYKAASLSGIPNDLRTEIRMSLEEAIAPEAEYSLMCETAIGALGGLPPRSPQPPPGT